MYRINFFPIVLSITFLFLLISCARLPKITPTYEPAQIELGGKLGGGISYQTGSGEFSQGFGGYLYYKYAYKFTRYDVNMSYGFRGLPGIGTLVDIIGVDIIRFEPSKVKRLEQKMHNIIRDIIRFESSLNFYYAKGQGSSDAIFPVYENGILVDSLEVRISRKICVGMIVSGKVCIDPKNFPVIISGSMKWDFGSETLFFPITYIPIDIGIKFKNKERITIGTTLFLDRKFVPAIVYDTRILTHFWIKSVRLTSFIGIGTWGIPYLLKGLPHSKDDATPFDFTIGVGITVR